MPRSRRTAATTATRTSTTTASPRASPRRCRRPTTLPAWRKPAVSALWAATGVGAAFALPGAVTDVARECYRVVGAHPVSLIGDLAAGIALLGSLALGRRGLRAARQD